MATSSAASSGECMLLSLPRDVLLAHLLLEPVLDRLDLCLCRMVCGRLRQLLPARYAAVPVLLRAAQRSSLHIVQWACRVQPRHPLPRALEHVLLHASSEELIRWAIQQGAVPSLTTTRLASRRGQLSLLQWLRQEHGAPLDDGCCSEAAGEGALAVLQWLRQVHNVPWTSGVCYRAAGRGHLELLQWALDNGAPLDLSLCTSGAAHGGHLHVLRYLCATPGAQVDFLQLVVQASTFDHLDIVRWVADQDSTVLPHVLLYAPVYGGALRCLRYLHEEWGARLPNTAAMEAAARGHLHVLQWVHERGVSVLTPMVFAAAAKKARMQVLEWLWEVYSQLRAQQPPAVAALEWDGRCFTAAAIEGHLHVLNWLLSHGATVDYHQLHILLHTKFQCRPSKEELARLEELTLWSMQHPVVQEGLRRVELEQQQRMTRLLTLNAAPPASDDREPAAEGRGCSVQ
jgi:hypothetical protein